MAGALTLLFVSATMVKIVDGLQSRSKTQELAVTGDLASELNRAIIELSLERSVMQVTLNLETPIAPEFRAMIDQQRALSDVGLARVNTELRADNRLRRKQEFLSAFDQLQGAVADIRQRADAELALAAAERNPGEVEAIPTELKSRIEAFARLPLIIRGEAVKVPSVVQTLQSIQQRAWEVREYGGQERTYLAIAAATGARIDPARLAEMSALHKRATFALEALKHLRGYKGLDPVLIEQLDLVVSFYQ